MGKQMYRAQRLRDSRKYLALAGLALIVLGFGGLLLGQFSYATETRKVEAGPLTVTIGERYNTKKINAAAVAAIAAGGLLTYLGRKTA
jgi:hypothetical protein